MPGMATFFVIAGLSSLGLPGLAGFVAEFLVFLGAWVSAHPWWLFPGVFGAFITAVYVLRAVKMIFLGPPNPKYAELPDARGMEWVTLVVLERTADRPRALPPPAAGFDPRRRRRVPDARLGI